MEENWQIAHCDHSQKVEMSAPVNPRALQLPGIAHLSPTINPPGNNDVGAGQFLDRNGTAHDFIYVLKEQSLGIYVDEDRSHGYFESCPVPHTGIWFATGVVVNPKGHGIGPGIYAVARNLYPAHARIRKSLGEMMRKLSVTSSQ